MIPAAVRYARPTDLEHALELLGEGGAQALAGGQSLLPVMKLRIARPELVVDISRLPLRGVERRGDELRIGALTTWDELASAPELEGSAFAGIVECAQGIGDLQVRNRGTIGGSLAHADPASDMPAVLIALGARVRLRSRGGERAIQASELPVGPFLTALQPGELITDIVVSVPPQGSGSAYASVEHPASGFALAGAAAVVSSTGESVALTGIAATPVLLTEGADPTAALSEIDVLDDRFAPEAYRRQLAIVVVRRALEAARTRAAGDRP